MFKRFKNYIAHYLNYQIFQIIKYAFYESLNLIITLLISFYILIMNFVVELSIINYYNVFFIIINKFTKKIILILK